MTDDEIAPWVALPCPACGETELARSMVGGLVCMACGYVMAA